MPLTQSHTRERELFDAARRDAAVVEPAHPIPLPPSDSFPGYAITGHIHRGGQGIVYQAVHEATNRLVAIKVMHDGPFAGGGDRARFEREVHVLAQLNHPGIVTVHDSGTTRAGLFYSVMDYVPGQPLDAFMAGPPRPIRETLAIFARVCAAVNAAHLKGVIHRDLKPRNILIDAEGNPRILDFGLAKVTAADVLHSVGEHARRATTTGQFVGSLPWASPEQAEGQPELIDVRTDVYSLGVVLYQMLTGQFPYPVIGPLREILGNIQHAAPVRPGSLRREIDHEVETIVLKCLTKERERRYQNAGELGRDIERYLAGDPIEAKRDSARYVLRKTMLKYKLQTAIAAGFLLLGAGFGVVMTAMYYREAAALERVREGAARDRLWAQQLDDAVKGWKQELNKAAGDVAEIPCEPRNARGDAQMRYFLIGAGPDAAPPEGFRLMLILPGGDGSSNFNAFVRRIQKMALGEKYLVAQLIAPQWSDVQKEQLVWPTLAKPWEGMRFSTEEFIEQVVEDVASIRTLDRNHVYAMGWSSGGPPCYAEALKDKTPLTGAIMAMSIFVPRSLPPLENAKGRAFYVMHSPEDDIVAIGHAQRATEQLAEHGGRVEYRSLGDGGHGWHGDIYGNIRAGVQWLEENHRTLP